MFARTLINRHTLPLILMGTLTACQPETGPETRLVLTQTNAQTPLPVATTIPPTAALPAYDYARLIDDLQTTGLTIDPHVTEPQDIFAVPAERMYVNGVAVLVLEYADSTAAAAEADLVSADGEQFRDQNMAWPATPHFFRRDRLLVLYVGDYPTVFNVLEATLGPQFAGGPAPLPLPAVYQGLTLPPPDDRFQAEGLPAAWLIAGETVSPAATLGYSTAFVHGDPGEYISDLPAAVLPAETQAVIVVSWPVKDFEARVIPWTRANFVPADIPTTSLAAEAQSEGNVAIFSLAPSDQSGDLRLDVFITFPLRLPPAVADWDGSVHYVWRLKAEAAPSAAAVTPTVDPRAAFDCANVREIPLAECQALVALFYSTNGLGWTLNNWLLSDSPCSWLGVTCTSGRVTALELLFTGLDGPLPAEVGHLTRLQELHLMGHRLRGPIPVELAGLSNLRTLNLSDNQLTGPIPPELAKLTRLGELNLSNNQLSGPIPAELGNLTELWFLRLSENRLTGPIPAELGQLTNLSGLHLWGNQLSDPIPPELGQLAKLYELNLSDNQLYGPVPEALGDLTGLVWLVLSDNDLSGPLPHSLTRLQIGVFSIENTGLCVPADDDFQTWLAGIEELHGSGVRCDESANSDGVTVSEVGVFGGRIIFVGQSTLPERTCLQTQLFAGDRRQTWWPTDTCAAVQNGRWRMVVRLGQAGTPAELDPAIEYALQVWQRDNPLVKSEIFPFDLAGPPPAQQ